MEKLIRNRTWKIVAIILLIYTFLGGLFFKVPRLPILNETIRVLHFHVPMWFGMIILFSFSVFYAYQYLKNGSESSDICSMEFANVGIVYGILGLVTGMAWANFTWGEPWSGDPKQNASAIALLIYMAYFILRGSVKDIIKKARLSAVYNIFAFTIMIPLLFILPRMTDSLHPGSGGNPGFNAYDLDSNLRLVFYPAVIGWSLLGIWITTLRIRLKKLEVHINGQ